ncbi:PIG-L family deacetylase [Planococcus sp. APC 4015]|nr:PIG-L family deacetylase [Planococcus sp. APC 4015]
MRLPLAARARLALPVIALVAVLAACAPEPVAAPSPSATPHPTVVPAAVVSHGPVPTVTPTAVPSPEPTLDECAEGSLLAIWAHYDDDLIFGHSRVTEALEQGWCVTVAYLSAGDAGKGVDYSLGREKGIRDAYDRLRGYDGQWSERTDILNTGVTVEEWRPASDPRLLLLSFRLVDGNLDGSGFESMGYESLAKLAAGQIPTVRDVDGPEELTMDQITHSLVEVIGDANPSAVLTGMPAEAGDLSSSDHSDHRTVASFARASWTSAGIDPALVVYAIGYQTADYDVNVQGDELARKVDVFSAYAVNDSVTAQCVDLNSCLGLRFFGPLLQREYAQYAVDVPLP